ncbi:MAG TPA: DUF5318 family protein [Actinomycetota bacterium]|nr:DUF5318 family protein [Actinomycetota bacterium]
MQGRVDYRLAVQAVLRDFRAGRVQRRDICDAHPDLLRAAGYSGEQTQDPCPVCAKGCVKLVSYVFSDELKRDNGRIWPTQDLSPLMKLREAKLYTVEVCPDCGWNHLRFQMIVGHGGTGRGRKASR